MYCLRIFLIFTFLILNLSAPAKGASAPTKVVVGFAAMNARVAPLWITEEQGILAKYGLQAQQVFLRGAPTLVAGMASGDINFGRSGGSATLAAVGAGHDFKVIASFSSRNSYDSMARPNIKRAEDLRGKKIAVTSIGGTSWMGVMFWLEHFGLDPQRDNIQSRSSAISWCRCKQWKPVSPMPPVSTACSKELRARKFKHAGQQRQVQPPIVGQVMVDLQRRPAMATSLKMTASRVEALAIAMALKTNPRCRAAHETAQNRCRRRARVTKTSCAASR